MRRSSRRRPATAIVIVLASVVVLLAGMGTLLAAGAFLSPASGVSASTSARTGAHTGAVAGSSVVTILPSGTAPMRSAGCGSTPLLQPGTTATFHLAIGGLSRSFLVHLPPTYVSHDPEPLVLSFHGTGSSAAAQARVTGFSRLADQQRFIVVYPQGTLGPNQKTGWASGGPGHPTINDVNFVAELLTYVQAHLCVDTRRVYATGFSNGGGMTSLLACRLAHRIAAFAMVSGSYYSYPGGCIPGRPVPLLEMHGTSDHIVPYDGRSATHLDPVMAWLRAWAARDSCAGNPRAQPIADNIVRLTWTACQGGVSIVQYRILGGIHAWPSAVGCGSRAVADVPCPGDRTLPATAIIWRFLAQYRLPALASQAPTLASPLRPSQMPSGAGGSSALSVSEHTVSRLHEQELPLADGTLRPDVSGGRFGLGEEPA